MEKPPPRYLSAHTQFRDTFIVHGGYMNPQYHDDLWVFNATVLSWVKITYRHRNFLVYNPRPTVRYGHSMTHVGDSLLLFGGFV